MNYGHRQDLSNISSGTCSQNLISRDLFGVRFQCNPIETIVSICHKNIYIPVQSRSDSIFILCFRCKNTWQCGMTIVLHCNIMDITFLWKIVTGAKLFKNALVLYTYSNRTRKYYFPFICCTNTNARQRSYQRRRILFKRMPLKKKRELQQH